MYYKIGIILPLRILNSNSRGELISFEITILKEPTLDGFIMIFYKI